jgi:hypothetical protein
MVMVLVHKLVLYALLGFLGISLVFPGLMELFKVQPGSSDFMLTTTDARNQFRALHGMMAGLGILALWACLDIESSRGLVLWLGVIMAMLVIARGYSILVDGMPGIMSLVYLVVELALAMVFLLWPPPL